MYLTTNKISHFAIKLLSLISIVVVISLVTGCNGDFEKQLPGGYRLAKTNSYTIAIFYPRNLTAFPPNEGIAAAPLVSQIGFHNHIVYGEVVPSPNSELHNWGVIGFFILDTTTGIVSNGLTRPQFNQELARLGINRVSMLSPYRL